MLDYFCGLTILFNRILFFNIKNSEAQFALFVWEIITQNALTVKQATAGDEGHQIDEKIWKKCINTFY